ncbi:putative 15-O-acetyltransferase Tri3 [Mycena venus]|uniref:Putative 15-O-acetyltransferase Tri3 n=1 Tax=Mycena venus TaxID=2733690 RepID=A0A8H6X3C1_9AGAR|nr:putative 15-O-acetyltransferase Tri3 [Mycena venus]
MVTILTSAHSSSDDTDTSVVGVSRMLERPLGDTETSYFLSSQENGVNDMYVRPPHARSSVFGNTFAGTFTWDFVRRLASCSAVAYPRFVYMAPESVMDALESAAASLDYRSQSKDEMIDTYLNGPRTLSNERLSYLVIAQQPGKDCSKSLDTSPSGLQNFDLLLCATHFIGDGAALHNFANDFFTLVASDRVEEDLVSMLNEEWYSRWGGKDISDSFLGLPISLEDRLPPMPDGRFHRAVHRVDFENSQAKLIGGHSFPRRSGSVRKTVVPTFSFDPEQTKLMLKKCRAQFVSISAALFSIVNIAWAKTCDQNWELPMMMYSALNLRPVLTASKAFNDSYWYLAIGYFNDDKVVLPTFIPKLDKDVEQIFWRRARIAKHQSTRAAKNPMLISRSLEMARKRGQEARCWAREDEEKKRGMWKAPLSPTAVPKQVASKPPSTALIGLSLLGNLDAIYKHAVFPKVELHTLTTGSPAASQRDVALWVHLCGQTVDKPRVRCGWIRRYSGKVLGTCVDRDQYVSRLNYMEYESTPESNGGTFLHRFFSVDRVNVLSWSPPPAHPRRRSSVSHDTPWWTTVDDRDEEAEVVDEKEVAAALRADKRRGKQRAVADKPVVKKIDWEIPRKVFHWSIGFITLGFHLMPSISPHGDGTMVLPLCRRTVVRLCVPAVERVYERLLGCPMRKSEGTGTNGTLWYILGVKFAPTFDPISVATVAILVCVSFPFWSPTSPPSLPPLLFCFRRRLRYSFRVSPWVCKYSFLIGRWSKEGEVIRLHALVVPPASDLALPFVSALGLMFLRAARVAITPVGGAWYLDDAPAFTTTFQAARAIRPPVSPVSFAGHVAESTSTT